jgi:hypothetical protein
MKVIQITSTGGPEVLEYRTVPDPVPNRGEVLVQVHTSGVNVIDVYFRDGHYKAPLPLVLGGDGHALPVWMKLHCRNGFLNDQGNARMDKRAFPSAPTELQ